MRVKVILGAGIVGGAILWPAVYFHHRQNQPPTDASTDAAAVADPAPQPMAAPQSPPASHKVYGFHRDGSAIPDEGENADASAEAHRDYVTKQESALAELGASGDVGSLGAIEAQLNNQDPSIRKVAVNAAVQIGSPDAIPALQNEMLYLDDPLEKAEIQKAIDFLQLPPL